MEKRLTAQGPKGRKSYTVTLPIEWVKQQGLDRKRSVELSLVSNKVVISPHKEELQRIVLDGNVYAPSFIKVLQSLYRIGVDEVTVTFSDPRLIPEIEAIVEKLTIGYEIIEQKKDSLLIKDITREAEEDFIVVFRRIFLLLISLSEADDIAQVQPLARNIKKLINYCQRILMKKGHTEFAKIPLYYLILDRLEKLGDEFRWLFELVLQSRKRPAVLKEIAELLRKAYELFYKHDATVYADYQHRTYKLRNDIKLTDKIDRVTIHLHNIARLLNALYGDVYAVRHQ